MRKSEAGYALIVILLFLALVLIALSAAVPNVLMQGQREKEEELLFRGQQYQTAIGRYYRKFGRFPMKMKDLLETNDLAFLRREYPDPMTKDGKWRLIRVGPAGQLIGSVHERKPQQGSGTGPGTGPSAGEKEEASSGAGGDSSASGSDSSPYPIIGVSSRSSKPSIQVYEGYSRYIDWEFIYDPVKEALKNRPGIPPATGSSSTSGSSSSPESKN
jgi:type II secretory pathway pseudopilin PulG